MDEVWITRPFRLRPSTQGVSQSRPRLKVRSGTPLASLPWFTPPAVRETLALLKAALASRRRPFWISPQAVSSRPRLRAAPPELEALVTGSLTEPRRPICTHPPSLSHSPPPPSPPPSPTPQLF